MNKENKEKKIYKKGELVYQILALLDRGSVVVNDILDHITTPGFGYKGKKSLGQLKILGKRKFERRRVFATRDREARDYQRVHSLLYYLERQGLITKKSSSQGVKSLFSLTALGKKKKEKMATLEWRRHVTCDYEAQSSHIITLVIFDIPERDRYRREWLRSVLKNMNFKMIQQSVWAARLTLPPAFIHDLQKINILQYILIGSLEKEGMIGALV